MEWKDFRLHQEIMKVTDLIQDSGLFNTKMRDSGQWLCFLLYGKDWMQSKEFERDDKNYPNFPKYIWDKIRRLKEFLERCKNGDK